MIKVFGILYQIYGIQMHFKNNFKISFLKISSFDMHIYPFGTDSANHSNYKMQKNLKN